MLKPVRIAIVAMISVGLLVAGCSSKDKPAGKLADYQGYEHLTFIPADTPYAFVSLEPANEELLDKFEEFYKEILGAYSNLVQVMYRDAEKADDANNKYVQALAEEFKGGVTLETLRELGFTARSTAVVFGHGMLPVSRIGMADTGKFKQFVQRMEKRVGEKFPTLEAGKLSAWYIDTDSLRVIVAISGKDLVLTALPVDAPDSVVQQLLGVKKPAESLAQSAVLGELMATKSYLPQGIGFIDGSRVLDRIIEPLTGVDKELADAIELANMSEDISAVCKSELRTLVAHLPRLLIGVTKMDTAAMGTEMLFEVRPDLAAEMTKFTAPVPGLGMASGFFSMGMSFDIGEMQKFALKRIRNLQKSPFKCEFLQIEPGELQEALAVISNPAAAMLQTLRGFNLVIDDLDVDSISKMIKNGALQGNGDAAMMGILQNGLSAHTVISARSTEALLGLASLSVPGVAGLAIEPDGKAVPISGLVPIPIPLNIYAAMSDEAFAFAIGKTAQLSAQVALTAPSEDNPPLLSYSVDFRQYMKLLDTVLSMPEVAEEMNNNEDSELSSEDVQRILRAVYGLYGDLTFNVRMQPDGVALDQLMEFP